MLALNRGAIFRTSCHAISKRKLYVHPTLTDQWVKRWGVTLTRAFSGMNKLVFRKYHDAWGTIRLEVTCIFGHDLEVKVKSSGCSFKHNTTCEKLGGPNRTPIQMLAAYWAWIGDMAMPCFMREEQYLWRMEAMPGVWNLGFIGHRDACLEPIASQCQQNCLYCPCEGGSFEKMVYCMEPMVP